jgi:hypothetical protein
VNAHLLSQLAQWPSLRLARGWSLQALHTQQIQLFSWHHRALLLLLVPASYLESDQVAMLLPM